MTAISRRSVGLGMAAVAMSGLYHSGKARAETITLPFGNGERPLVKYPQKRPLIQLTSRPPQLETPFSVYAEGLITPTMRSLFVITWPAFPMIWTPRNSFSE